MAQAQTMLKKSMLPVRFSENTGVLCLDKSDVRGEFCLKKIVSLIAMFCMIISIMIVPATAATVTAAATPDYITLTWSGNPATTQTISWRTDTTVTTGTVQYALSPASPVGGSQAAAAMQVLETELGKQNIFTATLTGLTAGTTYSYRVGSGTNWSGDHTFTTAAANTTAFKFLIYGDSQANTMDGATDYAPWKATVQAAYKANPDAKFALSLGDQVDIGSSGYEWDLWFDGAKGVIDSIPQMSVIGNHEVVGPKGYCLPTTYNTLFEFPANGPDGLKDQVYSFNYGNIHIIALDSQIAEEAAFDPDILAQQTAWLEQDLKANTQPWTIVMMHKPIYYNRGIKSNEALKVAFQPIFDKYHVDVVLDAHDHSYSRTFPMFNDSPVSSTNKGTVYIEVGRIGVKAFPESYSRIWNAFFYDPQDQASYMTAEVNGTKLTFKAFKTDGTLIDNYTIDKKTGIDSPQTIIPGIVPVPRMAIYGQLIQLPQLSANPVVTGGVWNVPVRSFIQYLGGTAVWNAGDSSITLTYGKNTAVIKQGSPDAMLNGAPMTLKNPVTSSKGITLISADDLKTLFGFKNKVDTSLNVILFYT